MNYMFVSVLAVGLMGAVYYKTASTAGTINDNGRSLQSTWQVPEHEKVRIPTSLFQRSACVVYGTIPSVQSAYTTLPSLDAAYRHRCSCKVKVPVCMKPSSR